VKSMGEAGVVLYDCEHKTPPDEGEGYPYLAIPNIQGGRIDLSEVRRISGARIDEWNRRVVPTESDIVFTRRGRVGDSAPIPKDLKCSIGQNLVILRSEGGEVDQKYLRWALRGPAFAAEIQRMLNVGAVFDSLNCADIPKMRIPVPPLPEQRAIAEVLGALDDKIESNQRIVQKVIELSTALFDVWRSTVSDWTTTTFGDFGAVFGGATPKTGNPNYWHGPHCWLTPTDATHLDSIYLFSSARTITDAGLASASTELHPPGTILMTSRATIGAFAVNQVPCAPNQGFIAVRPVHEDQRWFLFHEMSRRVPEMLDRANGTTFPEISRGSFKSMELLVPVNNSAYRSLDAAVSPLHMRAAQAVSETSLLAATRDTLLPSLLSGRLRPPGAAELLEVS